MVEEALEVQDSSYQQWNAESFILDEIEKTPDVNERLVALYDYFRVFGEFPLDGVEDSE